MQQLLKFKVRNSRFIALVSAMGIAFASATALAWDFPPGGGPVLGQVEVIQLNPDGSFTFRLQGNPALCQHSSGPTSNNAIVSVGNVAGINITTEGARAMLSTVQAARLSGRSIAVYANYASGLCRVGAINF